MSLRAHRARQRDPIDLTRALHVTHPPKAFVSWSSGKDSAFALHEARRLGLADIVGVLTTMNEVHQRVAMHAVRDALLDRQIAALGLPCIKVPLPSPCSNDLYEERLAAASKRIKAHGVRHIVFGDLFLQDIRAYRETQLGRTGMQGIFPLWQRGTGVLAREMIASGLVAHLTCIDPRRLDSPHPAFLYARKRQPSKIARASSP
jgi:diphthamide synthase (EF-2-diphthine--ammonia ligase)